MSDEEGWRAEPLLLEQSMDDELLGNLEEMAWNVLMQPPVADETLRSDLNDMGCPYGVMAMSPTTVSRFGMILVREMMMR